MASKSILKLIGFALLAVACNGMSETGDVAPAHAGAPTVDDCFVEEWSPDYCDGRSAKQYVMVCPGFNDRGEVSNVGVWSGAPQAACAPAEHASGSDSWCCWDVRPAQ